MDPVTGTVTWASVGNAALSIAISYAVSALTAPDVEGPRLTDLSTGGSSYGQPVPLAYGTVKLPGNVIWATDLIEAKHTESAKGGPEITTYTYSQHLAVLVCAGEVAGIRKIWANAKLIYDVSTANTGATAAPGLGGVITGVTAALSGATGNGIRIYPGSETQVADSLLESWLGAGNVPAHRGYCYVVFENLQLKDFGNRTPSFEFEVVASGSHSYGLAEVLDARAPEAGSTLLQGCAVALPGGRIAMAHQTAATSPVTLIVVDDVAGSVLAEGVTPGNAVSSHLEYIDGVATDPVTGVVSHVFNEVWLSANSYPTTGTDIIRFDANTGQYIGTYSTGYTNNDLLAWCESANVCGIVSGPFNDILVVMDAGGVIVATISMGSAPSVLRALTGDDILWSDAAVDWASSLQLFDMLTYAAGPTIRSGTITRSSTAVTTELAYDPVRRRVIWTNVDSMPNLAIVDPETGAVTHTTTDAAYTSFLHYNADTDKFYAFGSPGSGQTSVIVINAETLQQETEYTVTTGGAGEHVRERIMASGLPADYILTRTDDGLVRVPISPRLTANAVALSTIVTDLCERAGLTASDIDVSQLTDQVQGFTAL